MNSCLLLVSIVIVLLIVFGILIYVFNCKKEQFHVGEGGTISGRFSGEYGCASNVNGVNRMSYKTPYGDTFTNDNKGTQMYGVCEEGTNNTFDKDPYEYIH